MIYLGADHRGFLLKEKIKIWLADDGMASSDLGPAVLKPEDDYLDYAALVCKRVLQIPSSFGILICGTGIGMSINANRFPEIRAALCTSAFMAERARSHDDANILVLGSENNSDDEFKQIVKIFLATKFSGEQKYIRRIKKIEQNDLPAGRQANQ